MRDDRLWRGSRFCMEYTTFFVWKEPAKPGAFRVVHRAVKRRTHKGYPISYTLKAFAEEFDTWEKAHRMAEQLNRGEIQIDPQNWIEEAGTD